MDREEQPSLRGRLRPAGALPRPRKPDDLRKPESPPQESVLRARWLSWVSDRIRADWPPEQRGPAGDHWKDPRWDDLPPEWTFERWLARMRREGTL